MGGCVALALGFVVTFIVGDRLGPTAGDHVGVIPSEAQVAECLAKGIELEHQVALCATDAAYSAAQRFAFEKHYPDQVNESCVKTGANHGDRAWVDCQRGRSFVTRVKPSDPAQCNSDSPGISL